MEQQNLFETIQSNETNEIEDGKNYYISATNLSPNYFVQAL